MNEEDHIEITAFGDTSRRYIAGLKSASGTFTGPLSGTFSTSSSWMAVPETFGTVYAHPSQPCRFMRIDKDTLIDLTCGNVRPAEDVFSAPGWKVIDE